MTAQASYATLTPRLKMYPGSWKRCMGFDGEIKVLISAGKVDSISKG